MKCKYIWGSEAGFETKLNQWLESNPNINVIGVIPFNSTNGWISAIFNYNERTNLQTKIPEFPPNEIPKCPVCSGDMRVAANKTTGNLFFGCKKFPECRGMRPFEQKHWEIFGGDPGKSMENDIPF